LYSVVLHLDIYVALLTISQNRSAFSGLHFKQIGKTLDQRDYERATEERRSGEKRFQREGPIDANNRVWYSVINCWMTLIWWITRILNYILLL